MAYIPTVWQTGDVITAEKLNKAEQGIADASTPMLITMTWVQDNVWYISESKMTDAIAAYKAGKQVLVLFDGGSYDDQTASVCAVDESSSNNLAVNVLSSGGAISMSLEEDGDGYIYKYLGD